MTFNTSQGAAYPLSDPIAEDSGLVLARQDCRTVIASVGRDPKLAGCDDLGEVIWLLGERRGVLTPAGLYCRWSGVTAGYLGVTFSLICSVTGTILVLRRIGLAGGISVMVLSRIAQSFGIEFDRGGAQIAGDAQSGMSAAVAEDTLLSFIAPGVANAAKALADSIEKGGIASPNLAEQAMSSTPTGAFALFLYRVLSNMAGVKSDSEMIQLDGNTLAQACAELGLDHARAVELIETATR